MELSLKGKVVLITGASRGIGRALAKSLANEGASIAVHYNSNEEKAKSLLSELNPRSKTFRANLANPFDAIAMFENVLETMGSIDVLINNAGVAISSDLQSSDKEWLNAWNFSMDVNLRAMGILCKKAIEHFMKSGGGRIINIASRASFRGDTADYLAYAASKGGVPALTRSIARAFGRNDIKAFTIAPGFVKTDMAQDFMDQYGESFALDDIALNKLTEPKDLAPIVVLMASGLMDHATGCTIDVNAGSYVH